MTRSRTADDSGFRLAANEPLEGMRVSIDEAREQRFAWKVNNVG